MAQILEVEKLSRRFGGLEAVRELSFHVKKGEILGMIGPNGAGKTTVFNLLSGALKPTSGVIRFKGENIGGLRADQICRKGLVRTFQLCKPFSELTVLDNVMVGILFGGDSGTKEGSNQKAIEILEFMGLLPMKDEKAGILPVPQRKRLEIARAIAAEPTLLLLDEVVAGLNETEGMAVMEMIKKINGNGITIMIVEHVMRAVMSLSDRIIVLNYGSKIAEGTPKEIGKDEKVITAYLGEAYA